MLLIQVVSQIRSALSHALAFGALALGVAFSSPTWAQSFPTKPITLIVPFPAGGSVDIQARFLSQSASKELGQPILVVNRPGASGTLGPVSLKTAAPDGYTLTMFGGNLFRLPHLQKVNYDPLTDFTYVIRLVDFGFGITVAQNAPWKTLDDLLSYAKANPGKVTVGAVGPGAAGHVAAMQLAKEAGVQFNYVPYKGSNESQLAVFGRHVDFAADTAFARFVSAGTLRLLAVMGETRYAKYPAVPTLKDLGYDIVASSSVGIVGPRGMEAGVVKVIHDAFRKALDDPEFKRLAEQEDLPIRYLGSTAYTEFAMEQVPKQKRIVTEMGIKLE